MMFDFEKLDVYQHVKELNIKVLKYIFQHKELDVFLKDQWKIASMSIILNLAEGTGRMTNPDKKHYLTISRGSVFESVAILEAIKGLGLIENELYTEFYDDYEKASKMLLGMFRSYDK